MATESDTYLPFRGLTAWFSSSISPGIIHLWELHGGLLAGESDASYLFSDGAFSQDTMRLYDWQNQIVVIRSSWIQEIMYQQCQIHSVPIGRHLLVPHFMVGLDSPSNFFSRLKESATTKESPTVTITPREPLTNKSMNKEPLINNKTPINYKPLSSGTPPINHRRTPTKEALSGKAFKKEPTISRYFQKEPTTGRPLQKEPTTGRFLQKELASSRTLTREPLSGISTAGEVLEHQYEAVWEKLEEDCATIPLDNILHAGQVGCTLKEPLDFAHSLPGCRVHRKS